jgi:antitoxin component of MazEF toxin-antitoxin module
MSELFKIKFDAEKGTIPARLADRLHMKSGDEMEILVEDENSISVRKSANPNLRSLTEEELAEKRKRQTRTVSAEEFNQIVSEIERKVDTNLAPKAYRKTSA